MWLYWPSASACLTYRLSVNRYVVDSVLGAWPPLNCLLSPLIKQCVMVIVVGVVTGWAQRRLSVCPTMSVLYTARLAWRIQSPYTCFSEVLTCAGSWTSALTHTEVHGWVHCWKCVEYLSYAVLLFARRLHHFCSAASCCNIISAAFGLWVCTGSESHRVSSLSTNRLWNFQFFTKFITLVQLGMKMNWLDFQVKRSKVKVTARPHMVR